MNDLRRFVRTALEEDVGPGDRTTEACVDPSILGVGTLLAKQDLVVAGLDAAKAVFDELAEQRRVPVAWETRISDGNSARKGEVVATVHGPFSLLLTGERVALNLVMRLSGIATNTALFVAAAGSSGLKVVDTRKTTPFHRELEKQAVRAGGGFNHRHALFDGILIKDNHIVAAGGIAEALRRARAAGHHLFRPEIEVGTLEQVDEAIANGAEVLLLDNMDDATLKEAVERARALNPRVVLEASGNMTPERIAAIKGFGLDFVSAGGLIHQARWVDLSLKIRRA